MTATDEKLDKILVTTSEMAVRLARIEERTMDLPDIRKRLMTLEKDQAVVKHKISLVGGLAGFAALAWNAIKELIH